MPIRLRLSLAFVVSSLIVGCSGSQSSGLAEPATSTPEPTAAPGALKAAHEAYLAGNFVAVGERIRDVLLDPTAGQLAKDNALELLDKSYEAQNGQMPSSFAFPPDVGGLEFGTTNGEHSYGPYRAVHLWTRLRDGLAARVTNLTVRRLPDEVLLDLASGNGTLAPPRHDRPGWEDVVINSKKLERLPSDGVFSIRVEVDHVPLVDTWFLASKLAATAVPQVSTPTSTAAVTSANPIVDWKPFRSPEYAPFEHRRVGVGVWVAETPTNTAVWSVWKEDAGELGRVRVGDYEGTPKTKLTPGEYWLSLTGAESRTFGPITIDRRGQRGVAFNVVR